MAGVGKPGMEGRTHGLGRSLWKKGAGRIRDWAREPLETEESGREPICRDLNSNEGFGFPTAVVRNNEHG